MAPGRNRYFIALIPPPPVFEQALDFKEYFRDHFNSKAALNSPPHITLHMPFEWKGNKEEVLMTSLGKLAASLSGVSIKLQNFGCFPPRVIFLNVLASEALTSLQKQVRQFGKRELGLFNADYRDLPFHPHLTVAFRDLKKDAFKKAWEEFNDKCYEATFEATHLCLLRHNGKIWEIAENFPFNV